LHQCQGVFEGVRRALTRAVKHPRGLCHRRIRVAVDSMGYACEAVASMAQSARCDALM
jgi:hypothetical protein